MKVTKRMKLWEDHGGRETNFQFGDLVLLKLGREYFKPLVGMSGAFL
jgi:hypothetical protein